MARLFLKSMTGNLKWVLPSLALLMLTVFFLISSNDLRSFPLLPTPAATSPFPEKNYREGFLVHTPGCQIPYMNAFDPGIRKYLKHIEDIPCTPTEPLILSNLTSVWVNPNALAARNVTFEDIHCCYQPLWRRVLKDHTKKVYADNSITMEEKCHSFKVSTDITKEFIRVTCFLNGTEIYKDYHAFIIPKAPNLPKNTNKVFQIEKLKKLSVLIIGIDAVSRLNFYRQMPKTLEYLRSMGAIELLGYNKVDDNTFPNLVPVLAGKSVEDIKKDCWKHEKDVFDQCPFIWKNFHDRGYQTGFGEDACWMGIFQYLKSGFFKQPVDSYFHTMMTRAEDDIGHTKKMNAKLCVGPRTAGEVLFNYAEKFATTLTESAVPFFGFFWGTSLTHDYLNVQPQTDVIYETLLRNLGQNGVLNNTVVILLSDHGIRWGPIRETYQGRVEERLPLVYFMFPTWFKEKYFSAILNLKRNQRMLTSPYDLHETLMDLLSVQSLSKEALAERANAQAPARGMSLFLPVPDSRTCEDAGIPENWCTCHQSENISLTDPIVQRAALTVVEHVNQMLFSYIQCAQLSLLQVKSAQSEAPREQVKASTKRSIQDVTVLIVTTPGLAEFEATVRHYLTQDDLRVLGYVSRINTYGSQSKCVDNYHMRLYCFCP